MKYGGYQKIAFGFAIGIFLIIAGHEPAVGETRLQSAKSQTCHSEKAKTEPDVFRLFPKTAQNHSYFSLADGFVLCEFLTHQNARLNIYYTRKDISSRSALDMKRFYLGIKLDF